MGRNAFAIGVLALLIAAFYIRTDRSTAHDEKTDEITSDKVAVIDIDRVLEEHIRLHNKLYEIKKARKKHDDEFNKKIATLDMEELNLTLIYKPGAPEVCDQLLKIAKARAELQAIATFDRNDFERQKAAAYNSAYDEVVKQVDHFAEKYDVKLVLNFDSGKTDGNDFDSVMRRIKRQVVLHEKRDVTNITLNLINKGAKRIPMPPLEPLPADVQSFGIGPISNF